MRFDPAKSAKNLSRFMRLLFSNPSMLASFAASGVRVNGCFVDKTDHAASAENRSMLAPAKPSRGMRTTVQKLAGVGIISLATLFHVCSAENLPTAPNGKSVITSETSALVVADKPLLEDSAREEISFGSGRKMNGWESNVLAVDVLSDCNLTISFQSSRAVITLAIMPKHFAEIATVENIGRKICRITHGSNSIRDVFKFSLIDSEAQQWVTRRKAIGRRERLSERTSFGRCNSLNFSYNQAKLERACRSAAPPDFKSGLQVTACQWYSGYEAINVSPSDVFTGAEYNYAQAAVAVTMSGLEMIQNSGKEAIIDLLESRIENAETTLMNNVAVGVYSDGTGSGGRQIGGLQLLVSTTPSSGTVGGIDPSTTAGSFWRNIAYSATTDGGAAASSANIQTYMNRVALQLVRGTDYADIIVADNNYYRFFLESMQAIQRVMSEEQTGLGFTSLKYYGAGNSADVILDGGFGGAAPTNRMYFLNSKYIFFRPHKDRNFVPLGDERYAVNQDALVKLIGFAGNMTVSNRRLQGVLAA